MKKIFPLFAVIIVLVLAVCSFHIIPTGYTGVKTSFGQIQETTTSSRISTSKHRSGAKPPIKHLCMLQM